jgi:hypothetical protein
MNETTESDGEGDSAAIDAVATDVTRTMESLPQLSDVPDEETIERPLRMIDIPRRDIRGVAMGATFGTGGKALKEFLDGVEQDVDFRKAEKGTSVTIGTATIRGDGTFVGYDVNEQYLKPSLR